MRKLLNKPWFVAVVAIAALACVASVMFPGGAKFLPGFSSNDALPEELPAEVGQGSPWSIVNKISFPNSGRDPFAIKVKAEELEQKTPEPDSVDSVHLSALWTQNGQTFAVVNDRIYQDGDKIGRLKIESSSQDGVWFSHWKGRDFVSIGGNFSLSTPAAKSRAASSL